MLQLLLKPLLDIGLRRRRLVLQLQLLSETLTAALEVVALHSEGAAELVGKLAGAKEVREHVVEVEAALEAKSSASGR